VKIQIIVNSSKEIVGTVVITGRELEHKAGVVGVSPLPDQTIYELEILDAEIIKDCLQLHKRCEQAVKQGSAIKLGYWPQYNLEFSKHMND
jgi:hypothetical protein